jgi:hypothetical protein
MITSWGIVIVAQMQGALGPRGVVEGDSPGKGDVDMSTADAGRSLKIAKVWLPLSFFKICCCLRSNEFC